MSNMDISLTAGSIRASLLTFCTARELDLLSENCGRYLQHWDVHHLNERPLCFAGLIVATYGGCSGSNKSNPIQ